MFRAEVERRSSEEVQLRPLLIDGKKSDEFDDGVASPNDEKFSSIRHFPRPQNSSTTPGKLKIAVAFSIGVLLTLVLVSAAWLSPSLLASSKLSSTSLAADPFLEYTRTHSPYLSHGTLELTNQTEPPLVWRTVDASQEPPRLVDAIRKHDPAAINILRNRTVILLGDSVDRYLTKFFCIWMHSWPDYLEHWLEVNSPDPAQTSFALGDLNRSLICHLPDYNFVLINLMTFGTSDEPGLWAHKKGTGPPELWKDRVTLLKTYLTQFERQLPPIDFMVLSASLWDLAALTMEDAKISAPAQTDVEISRIRKYYDRLVDIVTFARAAWPDVPVMWRNMHQLRPSEGIWFLTEWPFASQVAQIARTPWSESRSLAMNEAGNRMAEEMRLPVFGWDHVTWGHSTNLTVDGIHPDQTLSYLWSDMLLWYMQAERLSHAET